MRRALLPLLLLPIGVGGSSSLSPRPVLGSAVPITAQPVALHPADPTRDRVGRLRFIEGWSLSAPDPAFGGFSALAVAGRSFLLVSDGGGLVSMRMSEAGAVDQVRFGDLAEGPGDPRAKEGRDAESLSRDAATGDWWIGFERENAVGRYDRYFRRLQRLRRPPELADWPNNSGAEAMVALADGRVLILAEGGAGPDGARPALLFDRDPTHPDARALRFFVKAPPGFRLTDAALLPDGRVIALHRTLEPAKIKFARRDGRMRMVGGWRAAVAVYDLGGLKPDAVMAAQTIARIEPPLNVDNMEGIAVVTDIGGATHIWLLSDDNRSRLQRTLLMRFALD